MNKYGLDTGATMATDGATAKSGPLELVIPGLPAGKHTLVTWHNPPPDAVASATESSPEFKGAEKDSQFQPTNLNTSDNYYWRVDEIAPDKSITKGDVWRFRIRHLAFPGAEGYGRFALGGRGGKVYEV